MKIGFIGTGNMGGALARAAAKGGHTLLLANRTPAKAEALAQELGGTVCPNAQAAETAELLFLGVKPQGLPGLYALFALPAAQYREADVLFVTALPLAAAASALFALPQVTARRPRIAYTVCACLAAPVLFWLFAPDTPYTTAYMDAPVGALFAAALCVILLPCAANSRVQRGLALAFLCEAYDEEHLTDSKGKEDVRTVLRLHPALAPYKCAVLPLSKKLGEKAMEIRNELSKYFMVDYDDTGSIGKRYRREDEIGTPFCVTVDFDTVGDEAKGIVADNCVTVRDRDTMEQVRMPISELKAYIESKIEF